MASCEDLYFEEVVCVWKPIIANMIGGKIDPVSDYYKKT